ncbi:MAG TPA: DUF2298 domain-containing protein, partial [Aggregatilineales bacterium]|nr:DUF2298 domain-containing protein [Aggregatilineales bacterium]
YQWSGRIMYLYPWDNIVLWGMGLPLGLTAWVAWLIAAIQILRARPNWTRLALPVVWVLVYFAFVGHNWVTTMRYFMPIYPFLSVLAAWGLVTFASFTWRWLRAKRTVVRRLALAGGVALLVGVPAATALYAYMFVSIYKRPLTRVEASYWAMRNIPSAFSATLNTPDGRTRLINWAVYGTVTTPSPAKRLMPGRVEGDPFLVSQIGTIDRLVISHVQQVSGGPSIVPLHITIAFDANGNSPVLQADTRVDFSQSPDVADFTVLFDKSYAVTLGQQYFLVIGADAPVNVVRTDDPNSADFRLGDASNGRVALLRLPPQQLFEPMNGAAAFDDTPIQAQFTAPLDGTIDHIDVSHLMGEGSTTITVRLMAPEGNTLLGSGHLTADVSAAKASVYGDSYRIPLDRPISLTQAETVLFQVQTDGTSVQATGTLIMTEGDWDDAVPYKVCPPPATMEVSHDMPSGLTGDGRCDGIDMLNGGWYHEVRAAMAYEDDPSKRDEILRDLEQSDYLTISSNRFYDAEARMPIRFPMTIKYYDDLFHGRLGFDLVKVVTSYPSLGGFEIADQNLPIYNTPGWVKEFQSEEAFSVYDHPTVYIFKKRADFDINTATSALYSVALRTADDSKMDPNLNLLGRVKIKSSDAGQAPTGFMMRPELQAIQRAGGTWSQLFDRTRLINSNQIASVVLWWLTILLFGWIAWPLLFAIMPGLPDRGYPLAKMAGLLMVSWLVWVGGTLNFLTWSAPGIAIAMIGLLALSLVMIRPQRGAFLEYVRLNWRHLVIIEMITVVLFVAFVFVRLGNPDLWAQTLGGEKPMDFSYLNAVLRSTVFPPYDPWYAGGYLNYYYYGYVLVGTPVKLLGIMPSIAYNLIVPTLFAMTGIGAFSIAFNMVASRWFFPRDEGSEAPGAPAKARRRFALRLPPASPYIAGLMALLLCVILGNLDTPRVILSGAASLGHFNADTCVPAAAPGTVGTTPPGPTVGQSICTTTNYISSVMSGFAGLLTSGRPPIGDDRWFWAPRSIVGELP